MIRRLVLSTALAAAVALAVPGSTRAAPPNLPHAHTNTVRPGVSYGLGAGFQPHYGNFARGVWPGASYFTNPGLAAYNYFPGYYRPPLATFGYANRNFGVGLSFGPGYRYPYAGYYGYPLYYEYWRSPA